MAIIDARGRRKGNTDQRVPESVKADMPAYGFEGLNVGEIATLRRERLNREAAEGKKRLTTDDKKY